MFKTLTAFCNFFKSLILQILWFYYFCDFMSYLAFCLYFGCTDFPHFFTSDFPDELRKSKLLIVKGTFVKLLVSCGPRRLTSGRQGQGCQRTGSCLSAVSAFSMTY